MNSMYVNLYLDMKDHYYINNKNAKSYKVLHVAVECTNSREGENRFVVVYTDVPKKIIFVRDLEEFLEKFTPDIKLNLALFYDPKYGDDKLCRCGHTYYRHFDSYEDMKHVGCKYCNCYLFDNAEG